MNKKQAAPVCEHSVKYVLSVGRFYCTSCNNWLDDLAIQVFNFNPWSK